MTSTYADRLRAAAHAMTPGDLWTLLHEAADHIDSIEAELADVDDAIGIPRG
jgi:hypothetical protein